jgi:hypothetical protein
MGQQRLKAAEPRVAPPTARRLLEIERHIATKHKFTLRSSSAVPEPRPTNIQERRSTIPNSQFANGRYRCLGDTQGQPTAASLPPPAVAGLGPESHPVVPPDRLGKS